MVRHTIERWIRTAPRFATRLFATCLIAAWLLAGNALADTATLKVHEDFRAESVGAYLQYTPATDSLTTIDAVLRQQDSIQWRSPNDRELNLGFRAGEYWLRTRVENTSAENRQLLNVITFLRLDDASMYLVDGTQVTTIYEHVGRNYRFAARPVDDRHFTGYVPLPAQRPVYLYWHVAATPMVMFPSTLWSPQDYYAKDQLIVAAFAMCYGALLTLILYNLFIFLSTGERAYLFYVLFIFGQNWLIMADVGHIGQWIFPDVKWPQRAIHAGAFALAFTCFAQFTVEYLQLRVLAAHWARALQWLSYFAAAMLMGGMFTHSAEMEAVAVLCVAALYILSLLTGWRLRKHGNIRAGYYLAASTVLTASLLLGVVSTLAIIPGIVFRIDYQAIGTTLMGLLFSLALADRIRQLQRRELAAVSAMHTANLAKLAADAQARKAEIEIRAKNQFVATLSHEIRTPLNGVMGMADLLRSTDLNDQQRDYVDTIHSSGGLLLNVINDVLDYAKIEAGGMTLDAQRFEPDALLRELQRIFSYLAQAKHLQFTVSRSGDHTLAVAGDSLRLRQVLANLLSNALKFTERGEIMLHMHMHREEGQKVLLRFEVRDTGIGISEAKLSNLFEPFSQVDNSLLRRFGGTGLGLSICRRLLHLMGGDITVESAAGAGSLFVVNLLLPAADAAETTTTAVPAKPVGAIRFANLRVLIVEDNSVNVMVIKGMLKTFGIEPHVARDGAEAVSAATDKNHDLILMDCMMPVVDGYEATRQIRDIEQQLAKRRSVIIALSAHALPEFRERAMDAGMDDYLTKPVVRQTLEDMLRKYFEPGIK